LLNHLTRDDFAELFQDPVDTSIFTDYEDVLQAAAGNNEPMDLMTVRERLDERKYGQECAGFARDMRKIWKNCKIYNKHGTAIWHVADYMSKLFERLYSAWVIGFRDDSTAKWALKTSRPWEPTCRGCDGKCESSIANPAKEVVECDHCNAKYNIACLTPKLKKIPAGVWHCPRCQTLGMEAERLLSRVDEDRCKHKCNEEEIPKKWIDQHMYLVKWKGLGYADCTWETESDVGDSNAIAVFKNKDFNRPTEPTLLNRDVESAIAAVPFVAPPESAYNTTLGDVHGQLHAELYAQARALQFSKRGDPIPPKVSLQAGCYSLNSKTLKNSEVADILNDMINLVTHEERPPSGQSSVPQHISDGRVEMSRLEPIAPCLVGEYDIVIPRAREAGLGCRFIDDEGKFTFSEFTTSEDEAGYLQRSGCVKPGDVLIGLNGVSLVGLPFAAVTEILKQGTQVNFIYFRFLSSNYSHVEVKFTSMGEFGSSLPESLNEKFKFHRKTVLYQQNLVENGTIPFESLNAKGVALGWGVSSAHVKLETSGQVGRIVDYNSSTSIYKIELSNSQNKAVLEPPKIVHLPRQSFLVEGEDYNPRPDFRRNGRDRKFVKAFSGADVGDSSDDGDCEDAYFKDNFYDIEEKIAMAASKGKGDKVDGGDLEGELTDIPIMDREIKTPLDRKEFNELPPLSKVVAGVMISETMANKNDFRSFPVDKRFKELAAQVGTAKGNGKEVDDSNAFAYQADRSKRGAKKVEQLHKETLQSICVYASIAAASAVVGIPARKINQALSQEYVTGGDGEGDTAGGFKWRYAAPGTEVTKEVAQMGGRQRNAEFVHKLYDYDNQNKYKGEHTLRDYQVDGLNWLAEKWYKRQSCILADEMGLGKTVQIVSLIEHLHRVEKIDKPYLIVVPLSTLEHWRREFAGWTDLRVNIYHDTKREWRDVMREYEWYFPDRPHTAEFLRFNVLVTTYDTLIADFDVLQDIPFRTAIVDEAHRLRNKHGKLLECMQDLSRLATSVHGFQLKVLITGTPLQNNVKELWVLLNYIEPQRFPDYDAFQQAYGNMQSKEHVEELQKKIGPFMLRRVKEDVAKDIPAKEETLIDVELTRIQKAYYRAIFEKNYNFLSQGNDAPKLINIQMELRKCCNHPLMLSNAEERERQKRIDEINAALPEGAPKPTPEEMEKQLSEHTLVNSSGKMVLLDKLLPKLKEEGHKVLIFSQMVKMLNIIAEYCDLRDFNHERLDGNITGNERQKSIDRFNSEEDSFIFLLSTRAGGVGINLTSADTCIIFDSDWNPQNDVQAQARCHRIGQTKDVMIYRLITSRSFEQEMFDRASKKLGLEQAVLGSYQKDEEDGKPTNKELEMLLKKGAYALMEDDDNNDEEFVKDDIDSILAKRTRTRIVEGAKTSSWLNKSGHKVTKSKFTGDGDSDKVGTGQVDIDDPEFWEKVMPDYVTPQIVLTKYEKFSKNYKSKKEAEMDDGDFDSIEKQANALMSDIMSVMKDVWSAIDMGTLEEQVKSDSSNILLKISVDKKLFSETQRETCRKMLVRLEGERVRTCRTDVGGGDVTRKRKGGGFDGDDGGGGGRRRRGGGRKNRRMTSDDQYLHHSDSGDEGGWDGYGIDGPKKRRNPGLFKSEVKNMTGWAGAVNKNTDVTQLQWPELPLRSVDRIMKSMMVKCRRLDKKNMNIFSKLDTAGLADYNKVIQTPMDFDTLDKNISEGKYTQNMALFRNELLLVYSNCIKYNKEQGPVALEALTQLKRVPTLLNEAALYHDTFLDAEGVAVDCCSDFDDEDLKKDSDSDEYTEGYGEKKPKKRRKRNGNRNLNSAGVGFMRCKDCAGCLKPDCGMCPNCLEKPKFGGNGSRKKQCYGRKCQEPKPNVTGGKGQKGRPQGWRKDGNHVGDYKRLMEEKARKASEDEAKKKAKAEAKEASNGGTDGANGTEAGGAGGPVTHPAVVGNGNGTDSNPAPVVKAKTVKLKPLGRPAGAPRIFDLGAIQEEKLRLVGDKGYKKDSYDLHRQYCTQFGDWTMPLEIAEADAVTKRNEICSAILERLMKLDENDLVFWETPTEDVAPNYRDVVSNPMSFSVISTKVKSYSQQANGLATMQNDLLLTFDNCAIYNGENSGSEFLEYTVSFLLQLPRIFADACIRAVSGQREEG